MSEDKSNDKTRGPFYDATRMVLLAAVGAVSLAQDEMNGFVDRLVERGEMAEVDARKLMREIREKREKLERDRKPHDAAHASAAATKADIESLTERIAELTRQIEELKKDKAA
jgi:polyhydroxyalkanoate synthesis regulator phasin